MGGIAVLAKQAGFEVSGVDANVYPPMSTQLEEQGIVLEQGYSDSLDGRDDAELVIGNALSRGNPLVEYILNNRLRYNSGAQWLSENVLCNKHVLAVSGTHGKTTTSSMLAWILEYAGLKPGFLIGGVPENFGISARLGESDYFVVEADEYDTAFFDKRSKFVHYRPSTLIINNMEYDHADIFPDMAAIQRQFHHLIRTVSSNGVIIAPNNHINIDGVLQQGCWSKIERTSIAESLAKGWSAENISRDTSTFDICFDGKKLATVDWELQGMHNVENALAAFAAATDIDINSETIAAALAAFKGVKRRMELRGRVNNISVYDDFAHHPTAIKLTLEGLKAKVGADRVIAVFEPRSNTMKMGVHKNTLAAAFSAADRVFMLKTDGIDWQLKNATAIEQLAKVAEIVAAVVKESREGDHILVMSNGAFGGIHQKLLEALAK